MEHNIYEKDYAAEYLKTLSSVEDLEKQRMAALKKSGFFKIYQRKLDASVWTEVPSRQKTYESLLTLCDTFAKETCSRIKGIVDHQKHTASITISCFASLYFTGDPALSLLREIASVASSLSFYSYANGQVEVSIFLPYFERTSGGDLFQEALTEAGLDPNLLVEKNMRS